MSSTPGIIESYTAGLTTEHLKAGLLDSLLTMAWAVEARDPYTGGHLWRVSQLARMVAKAAGLTSNQVESIAIGGFLHDLGKIGIPDQILTKNGKLTDAEFELIKSHPELGWQLLQGHPLAAIAESAIRFHHEMPNGKGYPLGLRSAQIPIAAKIVGICDAFDAMTSTRPYRMGMPINKALSIIKENLDSQFDKTFGEFFLTLGYNNDFDHIVSHSDHGIPLQSCPACGPIVVIPRHQAIGEHVYCQRCHGEFSVNEDADGVKHAEFTGRIGKDVNLLQTPDRAVIQEIVTRAQQAQAS